MPNQTTKIWYTLADISGLNAYFSKPIFVLKPWVPAGWFEYHKPYNPNNFFFTYKGVRAILSAILDTLPVLGFLFIFFCLFINN